MDKLQVINHNSIDAVDSREVAQMMEKPHNDLMKSTSAISSPVCAPTMYMSSRSVTAPSLPNSVTPLTMPAHPSA